MPTTSQETTVRIRISLQQGEFEAEGPQEFVDQYQETIDALLERVRTSQPAASSPKGPATPSGKVSPLQSSEFPEILHAIPNSASATDRVLVAGWYAQQISPDATFVTADANKLLVDQGEKIGNPSQCMKNNLVAKRVFKVGKRFKVSTTGEQHVRQLVPGL